MPDTALRVYKGSNPNIDSYSAFFDNKKLGFTEMESLLRERGVTDCFICGIAYDVCVGRQAFPIQIVNAYFHTKNSN